MSLPKQIRIVEVGPRDGLQNEKQPINTHIKIELIEKLAAAGLRTIEAGSFVSPKWVPQMAGSEDVFRHMHRQAGVSYMALTPNMQGFQRAVEVGASEIAVFTTASEAFCHKNTNCTIAESLERIKPIMAAAHAEKLPVRAYVSSAAGCPYQGAVDIHTVRDISAQLIDMGCYEISICDTIGVGTPATITRVLELCLHTIPAEKLAVHFHNTYGQALANVYAALQLGIGVIDTSVAGLGGCPYAKGASGNLATEDVVYMLHGMGIETGIDLNALIDAGDFICNHLQRMNDSKAAKAILAKRSS